ncbi:unnamed protein product [Pedinophyceae sp. YPF-701]|nr:unnamed protein product [Pedinophyceae sp. YPF-701]
MPAQSCSLAATSAPGYVCRHRRACALARTSVRVCAARAPRATEAALGRRGAFLGALTAALGSVVAREAQAAAAKMDQKTLKALQAAFQEAFDAGMNGDLDRADAAWGKCIDLVPTNSASWSNRGTLRLQRGQWNEAAADLEQALKLEEEANGPAGADALVLNNLANARGAQGRWSEAKTLYGRAQDDPDVGEIARANYALAAFQCGEDEEAIRAVRAVLRKDPRFLDVRCALVAFLWAAGRERDAEDEWRALEEEQSGLGGELYNKSNVFDRVAPRWPPRPAAAIAAFVNVSRKGRARDYDGQEKEYTF